MSEGGAVKCPFCQKGELKVTDSRNQADHNAVRRRRECLACERRFTTFEIIELAMQVLKRDGRYEDFKREKLVEGLLAACRHTRVSREQVHSVASHLTAQLMEQHGKTISSRELGEMVMAELREFDHIAYIRFACEYRRFREVDELVDLIRSIEEPSDNTGSKTQ
jgi:transcriptional repressor NrdR